MVEALVDMAGEMTSMGAPKAAPSSFENSNAERFSFVAVGVSEVVAPVDEVGEFVGLVKAEEKGWIGSEVEVVGRSATGGGRGPCG